MENPYFKNCSLIWCFEILWKDKAYECIQRPPCPHPFSVLSFKVIAHLYILMLWIDHVLLLLAQLAYRGLGDPSHRHSQAQQGVVLILGQPKKLGDILVSLWWSIPVQTGYGLAERHSKWRERSSNIFILFFLSLCEHNADETFIFYEYLTKQKKQSSPLVEGSGDSHRENAQQLLLLWDVRYCRLCAVEEAQEDVASVGSVAVNLLCCLLAQAAHHTLHPACSKVGNNVNKCNHLLSLIRNSCRRHFTELHQGTNWLLCSNVYQLLNLF